MPRNDNTDDDDSSSTGGRAAVQQSDSKLEVLLRIEALLKQLVEQNAARD